MQVIESGKMTCNRRTLQLKMFPKSLTLIQILELKLSSREFPVQLKRLWNHDKLDSKFRTTASKISAKNIAKDFVLENIPTLPWKR